MTPEQRLAELGITLPVVPTPVANYVIGVESQGFLSLSGQGPRHPDGSFIAGVVGETVSVEEAYQHARQTGLFLLSAARHLLGSLDRVERVVKLLVFVRCRSDFEQQPQVANGISDLLGEVFGEKGKHARSAVGVNALPGGMAVEAELWLQVTPA